jgi:hypothetical protein
MVELTIKVKVDDCIDLIGIKETVAIALEEIHDVTNVEVVDVQYTEGSESK